MVDRPLSIHLLVTGWRAPNPGASQILFHGHSTNVANE